VTASSGALAVAAAVLASWAYRFTGWDNDIEKRVVPLSSHGCGAGTPRQFLAGEQSDKHGVDPAETESSAGPLRLCEHSVQDQFNLRHIDSCVHDQIFGGPFFTEHWSKKTFLKER
jgi:hypothetical protein